MNRSSEIITIGPVSVETYGDGVGTNGLDLVVLPSYGRDGGEDFDAFSDALIDDRYHHHRRAMPRFRNNPTPSPTP